MKRTLFALAAASVAAPALAEETRERGAHVHGVTTAEIAVEHGEVQINLLSPGMDVVGFEYEASTDADKDAVEAAIRQFLAPETLLTLPAAAECRLTGVVAQLHSGAHDHDGHHDQNHAEGGDHDDDHGHDDNDDHGHNDHGDHDDHAEESGGHSEFHARYVFACENESALTSIAFPFLDRFAGAHEIEVQYVTETGAGVAAVNRAAPELTLE